MMVDVANAPHRPVLRYHGGKWKLASWVLQHFPPHHVYIEPFGGAASVLLKKPRSYGEVYNDLDGEVVNVFRMLRDPATAHELRRRLELTPFARDEFRAAYGEATDDIDRACKMITRAFMGFGSASMTRTNMTGFRSNSNRSGTTPATDWANWPQYVPQIVERLRGVIIENRDAAIIIAQHAEDRSLIYADPPYPPDTRSSLANKNGNSYRRGATPGTSGHYYRHDMVDDDHRALAVLLHETKGMVCVSGYPCPLYDDELYSDWDRVTTKHMADGAKARTEALYMNPALVEALADSTRQKKLI